MADTLRQYGLGQLFTIGPDGRPGGWLWDQILQGNDDSTSLMAALEKTDVYRDRFGVTIEQQARAARGEPVYVMSPAEVIEYERRARQIMSAAGMPDWFYDQASDFHSLILNDISPDELSARVQQAYEYVHNAPSEVRAKFEEFYGVAHGDAALAAYVLDPDRTTAQLERATRTAYTAGMAQRFDVALNRNVASRIAELPRTEAGIVEGLTQVAAQRNLTNETYFERGDISQADTVSAVFEGDADARRRLEAREIERSAPQRAATGGAVTTQRGVTGAGTAGGR
jgi:hypothetical protein